MARNNEIPEVNAGSMADIAFLLLIFFLVTATIQTDMGLDRKLPPKEPSPPVPLNERNVLRVVLNKNDELMVESELLSINELRGSAVAFLDNGGDTESCNYCGGDRDPYSSENPDKAIISLNSDREASYGMYVKVQNELTAAYMKLRNRESLRLYGLEYSKLEGIYNDSQTSVIEKKQVKDKITTIRNLFPMRLSEAETRQSLK